MSDYALIIGNKNYSSWSLRAWHFLKHVGLPFTERRLSLDSAEFRTCIAEYSPSRRVPALVSPALTVWDSLAILEYAAELTGRGLPEAREARAVARAVSAEMHSGFAELRVAWPMNVRARGRRAPLPDPARAEVARIDALWSDCRARFGASGPWLFGEYSLADAMYAPIACRFRSYGPPELTEVSRQYLAIQLADPVLLEWSRAAEAESEVIAREEIGV